MSQPFLSSRPPEPWRECYERLAPRLLLFARQWAASSADAEDVVQTAFVRFWKKQPDAGAEHVPLLYAAVRSAALDVMRSGERRTQRELAYGGAEGAGGAFFDPTPEQREDTERLQTALERLPADQREVVVLRIWGELTFAEIGTALGISINTAAARYRYALEALRRLFPSHEYERV